MTTPEGPWQVSANQEGLRLDKFLVQQCSGLGRAVAARWIAAGAVTVNGRRAQKSRALCEGDTVQLSEELLGRPEQGVLAEPNAALDIRFERQDVVVVEKPPGQPTVPIREGETGALANALLGRYPEMKGIGYRPREPGVIHRLDTLTSGLVVAARTAEAFEVLRLALQSRQLDKRYLAIVLDQNLPDEHVIRAGLRCSSSRGRVQVIPPADREDQPVQESRVKVLRRRGRWALVEVEAKRAFRHQVRVHLASQGWPIVGDRAYGGEVSESLDFRHALHASHVAWAGDGRVAGFAVDSPLPSDLLSFFER